MPAEIQISGRRIGARHPCYIVAELSANHGQSLERALEIIRVARDAGADAIKLQTYTADTLTIDCRGPEFMVGEGSLWAGKNLYDLYAEAHTPWEWQPELKSEAESLGLHCFSTPFDDTAVEFLENMNVPAHKIASFELVDTQLLKKVASTGKPVIMSTGMASVNEIAEAVDTLRSGGCNELALLKCTSAYPSLPEEMNLRTIQDMSERFGVPVGLSDHTVGVAVPVAAVALGACIIEKHLTLRRSDGGLDAGFSLEPEEFRSMVEAVRVAEKALGSINYDISEREQASRTLRRSLFVVKNMKAGDQVTKDNIRSIRPGHGLSPKHLQEIVGKTLTADTPKGTPVSWDLFKKR